MMNLHDAINELEAQAEEVRCWLDAAGDEPLEAWYRGFVWLTRLTDETRRYREALA